VRDMLGPTGWDVTVVVSKLIVGCTGVSLNRHMDTKMVHIDRYTDCC
jgi:hypothetical protein